MPIPHPPPSTPESAAQLLLSRFAAPGATPNSPDVVMEVIELMQRPTDLSGPLDRFGRRDESKEDLKGLVRPRIDELAEAYWGEAFRRPPAMLHLTHDLDNFSVPRRHEWNQLLRHGFRQILKGGLRQGLATWRAVLRAARSDRTEWLRELLLSGEGIPRTVNPSPRATSSWDADQLPGSPAAGILREWLERDPVIELGCHPGFSVRDSEGLKQSRLLLEQALGRRPTRLRMHYYRITWPEFFRDVAAAEYMVDMSIGLSRSNGVRHGIHHPFFPLQGDEVSPVPTIPTVFMDQYDMPAEKRDPWVKTAIEWCRRWGAQGAAIVHTGDASVEWMQLLKHACAKAGLPWVTDLELLAYASEGFSEG